VSLTGAVLLLLNAPLVLLLTRLTVGLRGAAGLLPVALYLFSPLGTYAVHHGALGQLYAAQGIALLTLAAFAAGCRRNPWPWAPVALAAFWLLAGSYNFILTVALAPAAAWLAVEAWRRRDGGAAGRTAVMLLAMLAACAVLFWGRFDGLVERFRLFEQYNFGWPVPRLSPEGWLGMLRDTHLLAWPAGVRFGLSAVLAAGWLAGAIHLWTRRRANFWAAAALVLPVLAGWGVLLWESRVRANASYDAFKLFSVFFPELLAGLVGGLLLGGSVPARGLRTAGVALAGLALAGNLWLAGQFAREMATPPLRVDRALVELGQLEREPRIASLNMRIDSFWDRLWANAFLLRQPQYFSIHTYEGRLNTALKGEWDLSDSLLRTIPLHDEDVIRGNDRFHAVRVAAPGALRAQFASGWQAGENLDRLRWRWSTGEGRIQVTNPGAQPVRARLTLRVRPLQPGPLELRVEQHRIGAVTLTGEVQAAEFAEFLLQPGDTILTLAGEPGRPGGGDDRLLAFALYDFELRATAPGK
jgi:hypothetical protein